MKNYLCLTMFSPAAQAIRQRIFGHITGISHTSSSTEPVKPDEIEILDPNTLLGADQVAFFDLKDHEDRYDVLLSTKFHFPSLDFCHNPVPTGPINAEMVVNALSSSKHATQKFMYRLNALNALLEYVRGTQCAHTALLAQREALITALTIELNDLTQNAIQQWELQSNGRQDECGLRVVQAR
jgi:hypothetical protein